MGTRFQARDHIPQPLSSPHLHPTWGGRSPPRPGTWEGPSHQGPAAGAPGIGAADQQALALLLQERDVVLTVLPRRGKRPQKAEHGGSLQGEPRKGAADPTPQEQKKDCVSPQTGNPKAGPRLLPQTLRYFHPFSKEPSLPSAPPLPTHPLVHAGPLRGANIHLGGRREREASVHSAGGQMPRKCFLCNLRTTSFYIVCE